jgi:hypothetical protein
VFATKSFGADERENKKNLETKREKEVTCGVGFLSYKN